MKKLLLSCLLSCLLTFPVQAALLLDGNVPPGCTNVAGALKCVSFEGDGSALTGVSGDNTTIQAPRLGGTGQDSSAWDGCYPDLAGGVWGCDDNDTRMQRLIGLVIGTDVLAPNGSAASLTNFPTLNQNTTGNAGTATALAANGANCSVGQAPLGVDASGAVEGCFAVETATGCTHDGAGNITCASYTTTKVNNTASQQLLYGDNGTQTLGAGWMGPHDTTARTANYYVRMPTEEPTDGQVIAAGTPSEHIAGATWVTPIRAGVTEITKYQYLPAAWFEDNATSPPAAAAVISGEETKARLFADNETSIVLWQVDPEWSAGLKFRVYYSLVANGEANDTAIFRLKGCTIGNSEALTCTAGDPIGVTDELGTDDDANELMITDWSDAVTLTGIAANELARLTFYRGSDDEAGELNVIGIELKYKAKVSAASDY